MTDISALTDELAEIYKQKQEVEERLNTRYSGRGRGRGRGPYGAGMGMGRGAPDAGYGRDRPLADAGFSRERPPPDAEYSRDRPRGDIRDRLGPEPGYGRELRMPPAEAAYGSERHPREPLSNGLSARMQDRLSGMRPSSRMSEPSTSYPSNGHYREGRSADPRDRLPDPRDRLPDPRDRHAEPRERYADPRELPMPPMDSYRDSRDRAASRPDRFADPRADSRGVGRPREQQGLPLPPQDRFAVPKVMSAVVVNGETRVPSQHMDVERARPEPGIAKRPRETADSDNPAAAKRNKRMFAGLLGTLQKFKADDEKFSQSKTAQQRAEALQRAAEQTAENERNAKQAAREAFQRQRREEINKKQELDMLARCKKLEIGLAARTAHHQKLFNFLKTSAGPPVLWMPAYVSAGVQQLLDARKGDYLTWKETQQAELRAQTDQMAAALQERIARSAPRPRPAPEVKRPADEPMAEADAEAAAKAAAEEEAAEAARLDAEEAAMEAEEAAEAKEAAEREAAELAAGAASPVPVDAQEQMDVDDRFVAGQDEEEDHPVEDAAIDGDAPAVQDDA